MEKNARANSLMDRFRSGEGIIYLIFILLVILFTILQGKDFLSVFNIMNILRQTAMISIMAVGMTFALSAGEIDLSVASVIALSALVTSLMLRQFGIVVGILSGFGVGLAVGLFNGTIVAFVRVPSFLVTLASMSIIGGLSRWITQLRSIEIINDTFAFIFGSGDIGPIPVLLFWTLIVAVIGYLLLNRTAFGRRVLSAGGNEKAAYFTGINTRMIKMKVLVISAMTAALAGMLYAGRLHGARYNIGEGFEMSVIAATVLGGTSLFGGIGTILGSIVGAIVIGIINNGLILMGLDISQQMFFRGIILIVAISLNTRLQLKQ
ncbi:MAG: ABC transporter permease [Spirochaetia bacterium]|jgi:ribose transport system permease protein